MSDPDCLLLAPDAQWPNSALPALAYRAVLPDSRQTAGEFETLFNRNGWPAAWRDTLYGYDHYHANAHECLGIARGHARIQLGGDNGKAVEVRAGDALVLPAGVAHRLLEGSDDLQVVGAYPPGQSADRLLGKPGERPAADRKIAALPTPATDPVQGAQGPLTRLWHQAATT